MNYFLSPTTSVTICPGSVHFARAHTSITAFRNEWMTRVSLRPLFDDHKGQMIGHHFSLVAAHKEIISCQKQSSKRLSLTIKLDEDGQFRTDLFNYWMSFSLMIIEKEDQCSDNDYHIEGSVCTRRRRRIQKLLRKWQSVEVYGYWLDRRRPFCACMRTLSLTHIQEVEV